jgi:hypothetical protein
LAPVASNRLRRGGLKEAKVNKRDNTIPGSMGGFVRIRGLASTISRTSRSRFLAARVFTGVSGSGKSSLAFGTLYAEPAALPQVRLAV